MQSPHFTIRPLDPDDVQAAVAVIDAASRWYASFLPPEEWSAPEMTVAQWREEATRMGWHGCWRDTDLIGVMGLEPRLDAFLIRHAYVDPERQRTGVGSALLFHLESLCPPRALVIAGTYTANDKAAALFTRQGYVRSADSDSVLQRYYSITSERRRTSITFEKHLR